MQILDRLWFFRSWNGFRFAWCTWDNDQKEHFKDLLLLNIALSITFDGCIGSAKQNAIVDAVCIGIQWYICEKFGQLIG